MLSSCCGGGEEQTGGILKIIRGGGSAIRTLGWFVERIQGGYALFHSPAIETLFHYDHDTGEARGLLCDACNGGIGKLKDSVNLLEKAIKYLKDHE